MVNDSKCDKNSLESKLANEIIQFKNNCEEFKNRNVLSRFNFENIDYRCQFVTDFMKSEYFKKIESCEIFTFDDINWFVYVLMHNNWKEPETPVFSQNETVEDA